MSRAPRALVLDVQGLQSPMHRERGIARYIQGHAAALWRTGRVAMAGLNPNWPMAAGLPDELIASSVARWNTAEELNAVAAERLAYLVMSPFELGARADAVQPPSLQHRDALRVVTLYDLIPLIMRDTYLSDPATRRRYESRLRLIESADVVLAISEQSRRDAIDRLSIPHDRVVNIGAAISPFFRPGDADEARALVATSLPSIVRPFLLCVSGEDNNRKNVDGLVAAYAALGADLRRSHQLVVACKLSPEGRRLWESAARNAGLGSDEVVFTGRVSDDELRALYQRAVASVSPSLYEGFGLPAIEAAACGCPSVGARTSALPELTSDDRALFDPTSVEEMAAVLDRVLADEDWRNQLAAEQQPKTHGFTWDEVARRTLEAIDTAPPPLVSAKPRRMRFAIASPLPPTMSGVADYTASVLKSLSAIAEVDAYFTGNEPPVGDFGASRVRSIAALERFATAGMYDALIYVIGNSAFHHEIVEVARRVPGSVWFHDVRLAGLYLSMPTGRFDPGWRRARGVMVDRLVRQYGARVPQPVFDAWNDPTVYDEHAIGLTGELVTRAPTVFVNSPYARRLVELDQAPTGRSPHMTVLPFGSRRPAVVADRSAGCDVVVPGWMDPIKQPELALQAVALLRRSVPHASVTFVGNIAPELAVDLEKLAKDLDVPATFRGHVDEATYWEVLSSAACAVALRKASRGESSAASNDCLAVGVPVVTNAPTAPDCLGAHRVRADAGAAEIADAIATALADTAPIGSDLPTFDAVAAALVQAVRAGVSE